MPKKPLVICVVVLLLCSALLVTVFASSTIKTPTKDKANNSSKDGQVEFGQITVIVSDTLPKGVEIPPSWKNISVEKHEPTERDWAFLKDAMKDLSEEDKDKLVNEYRQIYEGKSNLSEEEQKKVCQKIGYYLVNATEGV